MPQNFQNWIGLDKAQDPSSPSGIPGTEFQDWSALTGPSDFLKKSFAGSSSGGSPVAPPKDWGEAMDRAIAPFQQRIENVKNTFNQLGQGNVLGAYGAYQGQKPAVGPQQQVGLPQVGQPQEAASGGFDFSR